MNADNSGYSERMTAFLSEMDDAADVIQKVRIASAEKKLIARLEKRGIKA